MWCPNCEADVAAEVTPDNSHVLCATCGNQIGTSDATHKTSKTKEARELLERWSSNSILDPFGPVLSKSSDSDETAAFERHGTHDSLAQDDNPEVPHAEQRKSSHVYRLDASHAGDSRPAQTANPSGYHPLDETQPQPYVRFDATHDGQIPAPHFDTRNVADTRPIVEQKDRGTHWGALVGQLLAFGGVGLLTVGTTLVLWGYFGGPESYTPTGWLVSTVGQMLLFLGVITLVSNGLERTTEEVSRNVGSLNEKLSRLEHAIASQSATRGSTGRTEHVASAAGRQGTVRRGPHEHV